MAGERAGICMIAEPTLSRSVVAASHDHVLFSVRSEVDDAAAPLGGDEVRVSHRVGVAPRCDEAERRLVAGADHVASTEPVDDVRVLAERE